VNGILDLLASDSPVIRKTKEEIDREKEGTKREEAASRG
jgi:hypothetical protein